MHIVTFYPVANGDTSQIALESGKRLLFDFRHTKESEKEGSTVFNLKRHLQDELKAANPNKVFNDLGGMRKKLKLNIDMPAKEAVMAWFGVS